MTKASDNPFPYMRYVEQGSTPSSPAAGSQRLFVRSSDHILCMVDSSGTVTALSGSLTNPMTSPGDLIRGGAAGVPTRLADAGNVNMLLHGGNASAPSWSKLAVADILDAAIDALLPWHVQIIPMTATPDATTGTWAINNYSDNGVNMYFYTPGSTANSGSATVWTNASAVAQNDECAWDVVLAKGTWDCHLYTRRASNVGIYTLLQDAVSQGTVDGYNAATANGKLSVTGFTVSTTGKKRMSLKMATKNASSSNYVANLFSIEFRRTA